MTMAKDSRGRVDLHHENNVIPKPLKSPEIFSKEWNGSVTLLQHLSFSMNRHVYNKMTNNNSNKKSDLTTTAYID